MATYEENIEQSLLQWERFNESMKGHIIKKGKKYDRLTVRVMDLVSNEFCIDSMLKYTLELKEVELPSFKVLENLLSIAHFAQILYTKRLI